VLPAVGIAGTAAGAFRIYPNPAIDYLVVEGTGAGTARLNVIDAAGRLLTETYLHDSRSVIDVSAFAPGFYFVKVFTGDEVVLLKFILYTR